LELADEPDRLQGSAGARCWMTMVLKLSEMAPLSAYLFARIIDETGVPRGVFNLVNGESATVGAAISSYPDVAWCHLLDPREPVSQWL
jgi:acyl-CoA reductase-like NAD-dependent aldehyde dehydrogenase